MLTAPMFSLMSSSVVIMDLLTFFASPSNMKCVQEPQDFLENPHNLTAFKETFYQQSLPYALQAVTGEPGHFLAFLSIALCSRLTAAYLPSGALLS